MERAGPMAAAFKTARPAIHLTDDEVWQTLPCVKSNSGLRSHRIIAALLVLIGCIVVPAYAMDLPQERSLWAGMQFDNPIRYDGGEQMRTNDPGPGSPSGANRVFSHVSNPTYTLHRAPEGMAKGVGLVICPGGGYRDVWLDREGHDLAIWLKAQGVTSLVLKYRTNSPKPDGDAAYDWETYLPAVFADARQAIRVLRSQAVDLKLDPNKIGICGFSAGGNLAFNTVFRPEPETESHSVSGEADFAGLFYPWFREDFTEMVTSRGTIPPLFIMNAIDDRHIYIRF